MKKLLLVAALGIAGVVANSAHALTATGAFDVTVNLFPKCEFSTAPTALTLNYVSFQTSASSNTMAFGVRCTNTLPYALSITGSTGGTLAGLAYTLAVPATGTGSGSAQSLNVTGTIAANQGGTCAQDNSATSGTQSSAVTGATTGLGTACSATSAANAHVLTITY